MSPEKGIENKTNRRCLAATYIKIDKAPGPTRPLVEALWLYAKAWIDQRFTIKSGMQIDDSFVSSDTRYSK